jgi:hypothetical protein
MNQLKIILLTVCAASLSLIFCSTAVATDHPWDDNTIDTTGKVHVAPIEGGTKQPGYEGPVIQKIKFWVSNFLRQIKGVFVTGAQPEIEVKPQDPHRRHVMNPVGYRKYK